MAAVTGAISVVSGQLSVVSDTSSGPVPQPVEPFVIADESEGDGPAHDCAAPQGAHEHRQLTTDNGRLTTLQPGDGPVLPAGEGLEWLVGAVSPRLTDDKRFWVCLEADGALHRRRRLGRAGRRSRAARPAGPGTFRARRRLGPRPAHRTDPRRSPHAGRAAGRGQPPAPRHAGGTAPVQGDAHRRRDGGRGGARDEQPAGGHQRPVATACPAINGPEAEAGRPADPRAVAPAQRDHHGADGLRQAAAGRQVAGMRRWPISSASALREAKSLTDPADRAIEVTHRRCAAGSPSTPTR